jgi:hypothetical protein
MLVAVRIDADHVVQFVCKHSIDPPITVGSRGAGLEARKPQRQGCDESRQPTADKLLIKPAAGARPAPPCEPDGSLPRHEETVNTLTSHDHHDDTNPGERPRQTDPSSLTAP